MVEYHGWLNISQSIDGENESDKILIVNQIKEKIATAFTDGRIVTLKIINGNVMLHCGGIANHWDNEVKDVIAFFKFIATISFGTYGLLYVRDTDAIDERANNFKIIRVAKGKLTEFKDTILSPCNPIIEA